MRSLLRTVAFVLLVSTVGLLLGQSSQAGTGPTASLSFPVLPSLPLNLRTTATQFLWDYDFTQPNSRACTSTITTVCITGFTVQTINQTTGAIISGPVTIGLTIPINTTGPTIGFNVPFTPPTTLGQYSIQVTVNWNS